jgi:uncharacterized protein (DUF58 family)
MIPADVIARIRKIHIKTSHQVDDLMAGDYVSVFKGRGMEFEQVREYQPGDDVRNIDWNVTARSQSAFVKEFREEREMTVILAVDVSASQDFGTAEDFKQDLAAKFSAAIAFTAIRNNDKVGLILFSDRIETYVPPKKGRGHVWRVIREILTARAQGRGTDIAGALAFLNNVARRRAVVFLVSDFIDEGFGKVLRVTRARHDLIAVSITDPRELELTPMGLVELADAESGGWAMVDTLDSTFREAYAAAAHARVKDRQDLLKGCAVDEIALSTDEDWVKPLVRFFRMRGQRR